MLKRLTFFIALLFLFAACQPVKPYERIYLNDPEMQMGISSAKGFEQYVQSIREGAIPAGSAKGSGGCGCN
ncbi:MAG: DUF4266 domain-containing protein [Bacteroidota bacterium]